MPNMEAGSKRKVPLDCVECPCGAGAYSNVGEEDDENWMCTECGNMPDAGTGGRARKQVLKEHRGDPYANAPTTGPQCHCNEPCVLRTATTAANPGRQFYRCNRSAEAGQCTCVAAFTHCHPTSPVSQGACELASGGGNLALPVPCRFFEWADQAANGPAKALAGAAAAAPTYATSYASAAPGYAATAPGYASAGAHAAMGDAAGAATCDCGMAATLLTSRSGSNPGRQFFKCPQPQGQQCKFFEWADKGAGGPAYNSSTPSQGSQAAAGPATARFPWEAAVVAPAPTGVVAGGGPAADRSSDVCFKCNQPGHWSRDCPSASLGGAGGVGGGGTAAGACFKCGQPGHWSRDCPQAQPAGGGYGATAGGGYGASGGGGGKSCFTCGQEGHWSRDCPQKQAGGGRGGYGAGGGGGYGGGGSAYGGGAYGGGAYGSGAYGGAGGGYGGGGSSSGGGGGGKSCFTCGQEGHWSRDCPQKQGGAGGRRTFC